MIHLKKAVIKLINKISSFLITKDFNMNFYRWGNSIKLKPFF